MRHRQTLSASGSPASTHSESAAQCLPRADAPSARPRPGARDGARDRRRPSSPAPHAYGSPPGKSGTAARDRAPSREPALTSDTTAAARAHRAPACHAHMQHPAQSRAARARPPPTNAAAGGSRTTYCFLHSTSGTPRPDRHSAAQKPCTVPAIQAPPTPRARCPTRNGCTTARRVHTARAVPVPCASARRAAATHVCCRHAFAAATWGWHATQVSCARRRRRLPARANATVPRYVTRRRPHELN